MGNPKALAKSPPRVLRNEPDCGDAASTSSAMRMSDIDYLEQTPLAQGFPEDELPAYSDVPELSQASSDGPQIPISYLVPPHIPLSSRSSDEKITFCHFQRYSQDATILESMIRDQAAYPPTFALRLRGTHTENYKTRDQRRERKVVTDFDIRLNMTHLLVCPNPAHAHDPSPCRVHPPPLPRPQEPFQELLTPSCKYIEVLSPGQKGYRGTILKTSGASSHPEDSTTLASWCDAYVSDTRTVKTFTLRRQIVHHDAARLEMLCRDLIQKTSYRGHTFITFETTNEKVTVYSPCRINDLRFNPFIKWFCYLTFLWIFTWPFLFFATKRYEVVTAVFPYRLDPERNRIAKPLVQSEEAFFNEWRQALTRAILGQHQGWVDGVYREETAQLARAGNAMITVQSPENGFDGFAAGVVRVALGVPLATGWGADS